MKNSSGFALLVALVFVSFVVGVGLIYIEQITEIKKLASSSKLLAQQNALTFDTLNILTTQTNNINSNESLAVFLALSQNLKFANRDFDLDVKISTVHNKIPIKECQSVDNTYCEKLFMNIAGFNAQMLRNKLLENNQTNISYYDFAQMVDSVFMQTKDTTIKKARFEDYFSFLPFDINWLDCENLSPLVWGAIANTYSLNYANCSDFIKKEPKSKIISEFKLKHFSEMGSYVIKLSSKANEQNATIYQDLYYNLKDKQVVDIKTNF